MKKVVLVDEMSTDARATSIAKVLMAMDGVSHVTASVNDRAVLVECAPYVKEADLMAEVFGMGYNAEVRVDYSLEKAIADAAARIENHVIRF